MKNTTRATLAAGLAIAGLVVAPMSLALADDSSTLSPGSGSITFGTPGIAQATGGATVTSQDMGVPAGAVDNTLLRNNGNKATLVEMKCPVVIAGTDEIGKGGYSGELFKNC